MALRSMKRILANISRKSLRYTITNSKSCFPLTNNLKGDCVTKRHNINQLSATNFYDDSHKEDTNADFLDEHNLEIVNIRKLLYKNTNDALILKLNECVSIQEVLDLINCNASEMDVSQISQAVLVLWDLQKVFYRYNTFYDQPNQTNTTKTLQNYQTQLTNHRDFIKLLRLIENNMEEFPLESLSCILLYLHRMGLSIETPVVQLIIQRCQTEMLLSPDIFPLTALSRYLVTVFNEDGHWPILVSQNAIPIVLSKLETCDSLEDFKLITICLNKLNGVVTPETLNQYKMVAEKFIDGGAMNYENQRIVMKALRFLSYPQWCESNLSITTKLIGLLKNFVHVLTIHELILLFKIFLSQKEPADMLHEIQENILKQLTNLRDDKNSSVDLILELLSCIVPFSSPLQRMEYEKIIQTYVNKDLSLYSLNNIYQMLYHIKSSDSKLCDTFWNKYTEKMLSDDQSNRLQNLVSACNKYMYFNNDNNYRYYNFEKKMQKILGEELKFGLSSVIPNKFAKIASFFIAYCDNQVTLENIVGKLKEVQKQLSISDCYALSKGVQNANQGRKYKIANNTNEYLKTVNSILNERFQQFILNDDLDIQQIMVLLRSHGLRKTSVDNLLYGKLTEQNYTNRCNFTSNMIKDLTFSFNLNDYLMPNILEGVIDIILERNTNILGNTINKVLHLCYSLGYTLNRHEEFLDLCIKLIERDKDRFSGLTYLQAALSLCFYQKLPENFVKHIFSVPFLEKLDEELSYCYARATYPLRVRDNLMQLNRAVCIDFPGSNIPWFHQKYTEETHKQDMKKSFFQNQVCNTLTEMFEGETNFQQNTLTPYGYNVDFEITNSSDRPTKIALDVLTSKAYSKFHINLKGYYQLKQRHLEILGYEVVFLDQSEWKTMYTQQDCMEYLRRKLSLNIDRRTCLSS